MSKQMSGATNICELSYDQIGLVSGGTDNDPWIYTPQSGGLFFTGAHLVQGSQIGALTGGYLYTTQSRPEITGATLPQARLESTRPTAPL